MRIFPVPDASGGQVVGMLGRGEDNHVRFRVVVAGAGEYALRLHYVSAPRGTGVLRVNAAPPKTVDFPKVGDWRTVGTVTVPVSLVAGVNDIWFGRPEGPAPALDRITVAEPTGDEPEAADEAGP